MALFHLGQINVNFSQLKMFFFMTDLILQGEAGCVILYMLLGDR